MKTRGEMFEERKKYVEKMANLLSEFQDFGDLRYVRTYKTDSEYLRLTNIFGNAFFLDITGMPLCDIYRDVSNIVVNCKEPKSMINNQSILRTIARYFM